jgi:hypothetical protein
MCESASTNAPCSNAAWKPAARIRSACIWPRSSIRWPAIRSMVVPKAAMPRLDAFPRQALHAWRLALRHPASGMDMSWESPTAGRLCRAPGVAACLIDRARLAGPRRCRALSTTRLGGTSLAPWSSLNLGDHVGDDPLAVQSNRRRLRQLLPDEPRWLRQVHGVRCVDAATAKSTATADAAFTRQRGVVCAVLTADCLPVLLCDERRAWSALPMPVGAGWLPA